MLHRTPPTASRVIMRLAKFLHAYIWRHPLLPRAAGSRWRRMYVAVFTSRALVQGIEELCGRVIERSKITACHILKVQFEGVTHTVSRNHGGLETEYLRFLDGLELCVEAGSYGIRTVFLSFSFAPVFQADNDRTVRSSLTGDQTVSCYAGVVFSISPYLSECFSSRSITFCLFERASR